MEGEQKSSNAPFLIIGAIVVVVIVVIIIIWMTSGSTPTEDKLVPGTCGQDGSPLLINGDITDCTIKGNYQVYSPGIFAATDSGIRGDYQMSAKTISDCIGFSESQGGVAWAFNGTTTDAPCRVWVDTPYAVSPDMSGWSCGVLVGSPAPSDGNAGRQGNAACSSQASPYNLNTSTISCNDNGEYLAYTGDAYPAGTGKYMGDAQSSATSWKECRKLCEATDGCQAFAISTDKTGTFPCRVFTESIPAITNDFSNWTTYILDSTIME